MKINYIHNNCLYGIGCQARVTLNDLVTVKKDKIRYDQLAFGKGCLAKLPLRILNDRADAQSLCHTLEVNESILWVTGFLRAQTV